MTITWSPTGPAPLPEWSIHYIERPLVDGVGRPVQATVIEPFNLSPASCELDLLVGGDRFTIPIIVRDLAALPVDASLSGLSLQELLALLGRRIGSERLTTLKSQRGSEGMHLALEAIFGEGFAPTDVFRAWWSLAADLGGESTTLGRFRARLEGALSARAVWQRLSEAISGEPGTDSLSPDEVWFYGAELAVTLQSVVVPEGPDAPAKRALLERFVSTLRDELSSLAPDASRGRWVRRVLEHYAGEGT